jgi:RHS repeat-associated protein
MISLRMKALLRNFTFIALTGLLTIFSADAQNVSYQPLHTGSSFDGRAINQSLAVGSTAGAGGVSAVGSATYSIPIAVPPGTNGVVPQVSLEYNSSAKSGIAGIGWNISGLSVISRVARNVYFDGTAGPVELSVSDRYALDGQRLILKEGTYSVENSTYGTEIENFATVTAKGTQGNGPQWFEMTTKDGVVMQYGNSGDSRFMDGNNNTVMFWRINKITNPEGNYIEFQYDNADRDPRILAIRYTGNTNAGLSPYNTIEFSYKVRQDGSFSDITTMYEAGSSIVSKYLIDQITIKVEGNTAKRYQFEYGHDNVNSYLKSITEFGSDNSQLNPTTFKYGDTPTIVTNATASVQPGNEIQAQVGDYNGDGSIDLMTFTYDHSDDFGFDYVNQFKIWGKNPTGYSLLTTQNLPVTSSYVVDKRRTVPARATPIRTDVNGDGIDDIVVLDIQYVPSNGNYNRLESIKHFVNMSGGTSFSSESQPYPSVGGTVYRRIPSSGNFFYPGDYDGDGITEYVVVLGNDQGSSYSVIYYDNVPGQLNTWSMISNFTNSVKSGSEWYQAADSQVMDFNGDGKADLMLMWGTETEIFSFESPYAVKSIFRSNSFFHYTDKLHFGDFNGDGKADVLKVSENFNAATVSISTGSGFNDQTLTFEHPWTTGPELGTQHDLVFVGDFNGDGKSDIYYDWGRIFYYPSSEYPELIDLHNYYGADIYYSRGNSFAYNQASFNFSIDRNVDRPSSRGSFRDDFVVDLNGDGRSDIVTTNGNELGIKYINNEGRDNLIHRVRTGINHETEWTFKSLVGDNSFYNTGSGTSNYPLNIITPAAKTVWTIKGSNGVGSMSQTIYSYEGMRLHRAGKGILGFGKVAVANSDLGTRAISEYEFNTTYYASAPKEATSLLWDNTLISKTTQTNEFVSASQAKRFWVKTTGISENRALEGTTISTSNTYNNDGNLTNSSVSTGSETTSTITEYEAHPGSIPNRPSRVTVTRTRNEEGSFIATTKYNYNGLGQLTSKIDFEGKGKAVTTSYGYNTFGNVTSTTISASGVSNRSTSSVYDLKGRYPETATNVLGYQSTTNYDAKWGQPLAATDVDNLTVTNTYDGFGRLNTSNVWNDYTINTTRSWDITGTKVWKETTSYSQSGQAATTEWFDLVGRSVRKETAAFGSGTIENSTVYDIKGSVYSIEQPHINGESFVTTINQYDTYNRLLHSNSGPLGSISYGYSYSGGNTTVTINTPSGSSSKTSDITGKVIAATDNGGSLYYTYYSHGGLKEVKNGGATLSYNEYDEYGRQTKLAEPNAGTTEYAYNAYGELTWQKSPKGDEHSMSYDSQGRVTLRTGPEGNTGYEYYTSDEYGGKSRGELKKVNGFAGNSTEIRYDGRGRINWKNEKIDNQDHVTIYSYNSYGNVTQTNFPSGFIEKNEFDSNGYLTNIKNGSDQTLYSTTSMNGQGQVTNYTKGNGKSSSIDYQNGFPTRFNTNGVQDLRMEWDYSKGNLGKRYDARKNKEENFGYDNLNRLTSANISGGTSFSANYTSNGNIGTKTDAGSYSYDGIKFNVATGLTNPNYIIPSISQDVTYTAFQQPQKVTEGEYELNYTYGSDYNRIKSELKQNGSIIRTRYYFIEFEKDNTGRYIHYINSPVGLIAIVENNNIHYAYTDHLGSIVAVTNGSGTIEHEMNFDAWGRRRDPNSWNLLAPTVATNLPDWLYRGYTGHEHLDQFGLINMNGRLYDPVLARMLSPDNFVQDTYDTQSYNRYTYARNNPLLYSDPDGNNPLISMAVGAVIGGLINGTIYSMQGKDYFQGFWRGAVTGAIGGLTGTYAPIGAAGGFLYGAASGALTGGVGAALTGGNFWQGAAWGAAFGAVVGSFAGAIEAEKLGANMWTGSRPDHYMKVDGNVVNGSTPAEYSNDYLRKFKLENYNDIKGVSMNMEYRPANIRVKGDQFIAPNGDAAYAVTRHSFMKHGTKSNVYFAKAAFSSKEQLAVVMAHEFGHVLFAQNPGLYAFSIQEIAKNGPLNTLGHQAIQTMTRDLILKNNWNIHKIGGQVTNFTFWSSEANLMNVINKLVRPIKFP